MNDAINPSEVFAGRNRYVLEVRGDSMEKIGIMDGDFVVINQQESACNGDIVVALVDRDEATLKRIQYLAGGRIRLSPENSTMKPVEYEPGRVQVQGKMLALFRHY